MRTHLIRRTVRSGQAAALLLALVGASCSLDKVDIPSALVGPAELGLSLRLTANPDWVLADNVSRSDIIATLLDQNGKPVAGRVLVFAIQSEDGAYAAIGELSSPTAVTDGSGIARIAYYAPARWNSNVDTFVFIAARVSTTDAGGEQLRRVKIQIVPAERPLFPPNANNTVPTCSFAIQPFLASYAVWQEIHFQSTASDADGRIVRYEWDFGDGGVSSSPDENHHFASAGTFTVTHTVADNNGAQASCFSTITVK